MLMCKHKYVIGLFQAPDTCFLNQVYEEYKKELGKLKLPIDDEGNCLFHSKNEAWKLQNKFELHLERLFSLMLEDRAFKSVDFRGFHFVTKEDKGIKWKNLTTFKSVNLCGASFDTSFAIEDCHFGGELYLDKANILGVWSVENTVFSTNFTAIQGAEFQSNVYMKEVVFHDLFDVQDARFIGQINLNAVAFKGYAQWDRTIFKSDKNSFSYFQFSIEGNATFRETQFHDIVQFENCIFEGDTQFTHTQFKKGVFLTNPTFKANVRFQGISEEDRMFEDELEIVMNTSSFQDAAQLIFENANLIFLDRHTKNKLTDFKAKRLVVLGEGTIVFKVIFEERYDYNELSELFISDLLQTIRQYFKKRLSKHFEIVMSREESDLIITFHTDDYVKQEDFKQDKNKIVKELVQNMNKSINDVFLDYLHNKFHTQVQSTIEHTFNKTIAPQVIQGLLGKENLKLVLENPSIASIYTETLQIDEVKNSQFYIDKLMGMNNDPVFQLADAQFNDLVKQLSAVKDDEKWEELKTLVTAIQKDLAIQNELLPFLGECGVSIGNNLSAGAIFIFLQHFMIG